MSEARQRFTPEELREVLQHYALGKLGTAKDYPRGSRRSPKVFLQSERGSFLLKRRAVDRDDPQQVAFTHALLDHLQATGFPVPKLITTTEDETLLRLDGRTYELFTYVRAERYDSGLGETQHAGRTLGRYHARVSTFEWDTTTRRVSYHDRGKILKGLNTIPNTVSSHDSVIGHETELLMLTQELYERYEEAGDAVNRAGFAQWPETFIHGDWHPGNMLFGGQKVAVVLDFDCVRIQPAIIDLANGMLQFSILRGDAPPEEWPAFFDESRMRRFLMGYQSRVAVSDEQLDALPALAVEALIAESVVPIAVTGSFGMHPGYGVLQMVRRKVRWIQDNADRMVGWMRDAGGG